MLRCWLNAKFVDSKYFDLKSKPYSPKVLTTETNSNFYYSRRVKKKNCPSNTRGVIKNKRKYTCKSFLQWPLTHRSISNAAFVHDVTRQCQLSLSVSAMKKLHTHSLVSNDVFSLRKRASS